jgi:hypothetical protein
MKKLSLLALLLFAPAIAIAETVHEDAHTFRATVEFEGDRGASLNVKRACGTHTTNGGTGTSTITGAVPARARVLGVVMRVTTVLAGASLGTWSLGDGTDADLYGSGLAKTVGTTASSATATANPLTHAWSTSAGNLVLTASAGQFDSGAVRYCVFYLDTTAPAS